MLWPCGLFQWSPVLSVIVLNVSASGGHAMTPKLNPPQNRPQGLSDRPAKSSKGDCIVLLSISPHLFCYLLRVYKSVV